MSERTTEEPGRPETARTGARPDAEYRTVTIAVSDGLVLSADEWGRPGDPGVLMLHGAGQNRHAWKGTAAALARVGYHVVTLDARGHGDSDWSPDGRYDVEHVAADVTVVADRFEDRPAVVGASMGGMASLGAQRQADRQLYAALVLVDITPNFDPAGARRVIEFMAGSADGFEDLDAAAAAIAAYNPHRARPRDSSGLTKVLRRREDGRWIWRWDPAYVSSKPGFAVDDHDALAGHLERTSRTMFEGALAVAVPKLLVRGGQSDLVTAASAREFIEQVPGTEFVDVAGTGHMVAGDDNDAFTAAVIEFLGRHHPPGPRG